MGRDRKPKTSESPKDSRGRSTTAATQASSPSGSNWYSSLLENAKSDSGQPRPRSVGRSQASVVSPAETTRAFESRLVSQARARVSPSESSSLSPALTPTSDQPYSREILAIGEALNKISDPSSRPNTEQVRSVQGYVQSLAARHADELRAYQARAMKLTGAEYREAQRRMAEYESEQEYFRSVLQHLHDIFARLLSRR